MKSRGGKILERDGAAVEFEFDDGIFLAVRSFEVESVERERVAVLEAENYIVAVAADEFVFAGVAPE